MKTLLASGIGVTLGAAILVVGLVGGSWFSREYSQYLANSAPLAAEGFLVTGQPDKALKQLFIAKLHEARDGMTDVMIGRAYAAQQKHCLAQAYLESGIKFMERERLTGSASFGAANTLLSEQSAACSKQRLPS